MSEWDASTVMSRDQHLRAVVEDDEDGLPTFSVAVDMFLQFLRNYRDGAEYLYRDQLRRHLRRKLNYVEVDLAELAGFQEELHDLITKHPTDFIPAFEEAISKTLEEEGVVDPPPFQVTFRSRKNAVSVRDIMAGEVNQMLLVKGIVISAARAKPKATTVTIQCKECNNTKTLPVASAFGTVAFPRQCDGRINDNGGDQASEKCPLDSFVIVPDKCQYVDHQVLKLQDPPDEVPAGELPRHILLSVDRSLVDSVAPGTRVSVMGVSSIFTNAGKGAGRRGSSVTVRTPYLQVVGIHPEDEGAGRAVTTFTREEEASFRELAKRPGLYEQFCASIAPSISGADSISDIKQAIACLLMGGSRKVLPDGMRLRGDVNVLLLGDPSTAKSQFLKFVEKVAPVGVYTSGKGSSAAGLTATVLRDSKGEFYLEGGAMVLADGGVVCIDEFDKMREEDRVAIHEAMEQQTISVAKAGITTILNSRAAVLAAANPVFGRYDDNITAAENIDFLPTILSRFDLIFIVRDVRNQARDKKIAEHVLAVHQNAASARDVEASADIDVATMKKYISFCRTRCAPRLTESAAKMLQDSWVKIRSQQRGRNSAESVIPITVRQLEALVRLSEATAKITMAEEATETHVSEALKLFNVSTLNAASSGLGEASMTPELRGQVRAVEELYKKTTNVGTVRSTRDVRDQILRSGYDSTAVLHAFRIMAARQEVQFLNERRQMKRLK